jgi:hypothetical protein
MKDHDMPTEKEGHVVETAVEARAGFLDRPVLMILVASVLLVVVGFCCAWFGVIKI